jgi:hypothetical protein
MSSAILLEGASKVWSTSEHDMNSGSTRRSALDLGFNFTSPKLTFYVPEVVLLEKSWMRESASYNCFHCQFIANIGCAKTVTDTDKFRRGPLVACRDGFYPLWHCYVSIRCVLAFPSSVVEVRI